MVDYLLISGYQELKISLDMQILSKDLSPACQRFSRTGSRNGINPRLHPQT